MFLARMLLLEGSFLNESKRFKNFIFVIDNFEEDMLQYLLSLFETINLLHNSNKKKYCSLKTKQTKSCKQTMNFSFSNETKPT